MVLSTRKYKRVLWQRVTAGLTLFFFLATQNYSSGFASPSNAVQESSVSAKASLDNISRLHIPESIGHVEDFFQGKPGKTVVVVQDAHAIADAQKSIQRLIQYFQSEYGITAVGLEGASHTLDPQIFRSFPDQARLKQVLKEYLLQGELSGGAAAAIFSESPSVDFFGVEDWKLYEQGIRLYQQAIAGKEQILENVQTFRQRVEKKKSEQYSPALLAVDQTLQEFHHGRGDLSAVLKKLAAVKRPDAGTELAALVEEIERESTDQSAPEAEVRGIAEAVKAARLPSLVASEKQKCFNEKSQAFHTGKISVQAYALYLKEFLTENFETSDLAPYRLSLTALSRLSGNQKTLRDMEGTKFFFQFEAYAAAVKESLMTDEAQRQLDKESRGTDLLEKTAKLELTREEWEELKNVVRDSSLGARQKLSKSILADESLQSLYEKHMAFYENAEARDAAFLKNLSHTAQGSAVLVAGGFHAHGVTQRLKAQGVSYVLVVPAIKEIPEETNYQAQMRGEVSWKSYFEIENGKVNLYKAFVRAVRDKLLVSSAELPAALNADRPTLKVWRDQIIRDLAEKGRLEDASRYTVYLDEKIKPKTKPSVTPEALARLTRFIAGLRDLKQKGLVTPANILNVLKPSAAVPYVSAPRIVGPYEEPVAAEDLGLAGGRRSEVRTVLLPSREETSQTRPARPSRRTVRRTPKNEIQRIAHERVENAAGALEYLNSLSEAPKINIYVFNQAFNGVYGRGYNLAREIRHRIKNAKVRMMVVNGTVPSSFPTVVPGIEIEQNYRLDPAQTTVDPSDFNFVVSGSAAYKMPPLLKEATVVSRGFRHDWDTHADPQLAGYPNIHMNFAEPHSTVLLVSENGERVSQKDSLSFEELAAAKVNWHERFAADPRGFFGSSQWQALQDFSSRKEWEIGEAVTSWAYYEDKTSFQSELDNLVQAVSSGVFEQQEIWSSRGKQILIHASVSHKKVYPLMDYLEDKKISYIDFNGELHEGDLPITLVLHERVPHALLQELQALSGTMKTYTDTDGTKHWIGFPAFVTGTSSSGEAMSSELPFLHCGFDISAQAFVKPFQALTANVLKLHEGGLDSFPEIAGMTAQELAQEFLMGGNRRIARYDNLEGWSRLARWYSQTLYETSMMDDVALLLARQKGYKGAFAGISANELEALLDLAKPKPLAGRSEVRSSADTAPQDSAAAAVPAMPPLRDLIANPTSFLRKLVETHLASVSTLEPSRVKTLYNTRIENLELRKGGKELVLKVEGYDRLMRFKRVDYFQTDLSEVHLFDSGDYQTVFALKVAAKPSRLKNKRDSEISKLRNDAVTTQAQFSAFLNEKARLEGFSKNVWQGTLPGNRSAFLMESPAGQTLWRAFSSLSRKQRVAVTGLYAEKVYQAFNAGVALNDLKPENVLLVSHPQPGNFLHLIDLNANWVQLPTSLQFHWTLKYSVPLATENLMQRVALEKNTPFSRREFLGLHSLLELTMVFYEYGLADELMQGNEGKLYKYMSAESRAKAEAIMARIRKIESLRDPLVFEDMVRSLRENNQFFDIDAVFQTFIEDLKTLSSLVAKGKVVPSVVPRYEETRWEKMRRTVRSFILRWTVDKVFRLLRRLAFFLGAFSRGEDDAVLGLDTPLERFAAKHVSRWMLGALLRFSETKLGKARNLKIVYSGMYLEPLLLAVQIYNRQLKHFPEEVFIWVNNLPIRDVVKGRLEWAKSRYWEKGDAELLPRVVRDARELYKTMGRTIPDDVVRHIETAEMLMAVRRSEVRTAETKFFSNGLPVPAARGTSAEHLIDAFGLGEIRTAVNAGKAGDLQVYRVTTNETLPSEETPQGADLFQAHLAHTNVFELLYNSKNQLIAVFPVMNPKLWNVSYFDLSDYYPSWPKPGEDGALEKWKTYLETRQADKDAIEAYKRLRNLDPQRVTREWNEAAQSLFVIAEIDPERRNPSPVISHFNPEDLFTAEKREAVNKEQLERILKPDGKGQRVLYMLYPTVYSPGHRTHFRQDKDYNEEIFSQARSHLQDGDVDWDDASGSGIGVWIKYQATKGKRIRRLASDINALAAANIRQLADAVNSQRHESDAVLEVQVAVNDTSKGILPFEGVQTLKMATSNSGAFTAVIDKADTAATVLDKPAPWWDNDEGGLYLSGFSKILGKVLADKAAGGIGVTWNVIPWGDSQHPNPMLPRITKNLKSGGLDVRVLYDDSDGDGETTITIHLEQPVVRRFQNISDEVSHRLAQNVWKAIKDPAEMTDFLPAQEYEGLQSRRSVETFFTAAEGLEVDVVVRQVGPLIFIIAEKMTETVLRALKEKLDGELAEFPGNIIFTQKAVYLKEDVDLGYFTTHMISAMLNNAEAFQDAVIGDFGAGHGILAQTALALGAKHVMLAEYSAPDLELAEMLLRAQGASEDLSRTPSAGSFSIHQANFMISEGARKIEDLAKRTDIALVNIGPWSEYGGVNAAVLKVLKAHLHWKLLLNSGYRIDIHKTELNLNMDLFPSPRFDPRILRYSGGSSLSNVLWVKRMPAAKSEVRSQPETAAGEPVFTPENIRIMVAEDAAVLTKRLLPLLAGKKYGNVALAESLNDFRDLMMGGEAEAYHPDILILDRDLFMGGDAVQFTLTLQSEGFLTGRFGQKTIVIWNSLTKPKPGEEEALVDYYAAGKRTAGTPLVAGKGLPQALAARIEEAMAELNETFKQEPAKPAASAAPAEIEAKAMPLPVLYEHLDNPNRLELLKGLGSIFGKELHAKDGLAFNVVRAEPAESAVVSPSDFSEKIRLTHGETHVELALWVFPNMLQLQPMNAASFEDPIKKAMVFRFVHELSAKLRTLTGNIYLKSPVVGRESLLALARQMRENLALLLPNRPLQEINGTEDAETLTRILTGYTRVPQDEHDTEVDNEVLLNGSISQTTDLWQLHEEFGLVHDVEISESESGPMVALVTRQINVQHMLHQLKGSAVALAPMTSFIEYQAGITGIAAAGKGIFDASKHFYDILSKLEKFREQSSIQDAMDLIQEIYEAYSDEQIELTLQNLRAHFGSKISEENLNDIREIGMFTQGTAADWLGLREDIFRMISLGELQNKIQHLVAGGGQKLYRIEMNPKLKNMRVEVKLQLVIEILLNLTKNSREAVLGLKEKLGPDSDYTPLVTVRIDREDNDHFNLWVIDNGPGMPPQWVADANNGIPIDGGKEDSTAEGLTSARAETIGDLNGTFSVVKSTLAAADGSGGGTEIKLTFKNQQPRQRRSEVRSALKKSDIQQTFILTEEERGLLTRAAEQLADKIHALSPQPKTVLVMSGSGQWAGRILEAAWQVRYPGEPLSFQEIDGENWKEVSRELAASQAPLIVLDDVGKTMKAVNTFRRKIENQFGPNQLFFAVLYTGAFPAAPQKFYGATATPEILEVLRQSYPYLFNGHFLYGEHVPEAILDHGLPFWHLVRKLGKTGVESETLEEALGPAVYGKLFNSVRQARKAALAAAPSGADSLEQARQVQARAGETAAEFFLKELFPQLLQELSMGWAQPSPPQLKIAAPDDSDLFTASEIPGLLHDFKNTNYKIDFYIGELLQKLPHDIRMSGAVQKYEQRTNLVTLNQRAEPLSPEGMKAVLEEYLELGEPGNLQAFKAALQQGLMPLGEDGENAFLLAEDVLKDFGRVREFAMIWLGLSEDKPMARDLRFMLNRAAESFHPRVAKLYKVPDGIGVVTRANEFDRIFRNLLKNAVEAADPARPNAKINLRAELVEGGSLDIEVADQGVGIPADKLPRIWDRDYTTKAEGTGIGLDTVRRKVASELGSTIEVQSELGKGTAFTVHIPSNRLVLKVKPDAEVISAAVFKETGPQKEATAAFDAAGLAAFFENAEQLTQEISADLSADHSAVPWTSIQSTLVKMRRALQSQKAQEFLVQLDMLLFDLDDHERAAEWVGSYAKLKDMVSAAGRSEVRTGSQIGVSGDNSAFAAKLLSVTPFSEYAGVARVLDAADFIARYPGDTDRQNLQDRITKVAVTAFGITVLDTTLPGVPDPRRRFVSIDDSGQVTGYARIEIQDQTAELKEIATLKFEDQISGRGQVLMNAVLKAVKEAGFQTLDVNAIDSAFVFYRDYFANRGIPFRKFKNKYQADLSLISGENLGQVLLRQDPSRKMGTPPADWNSLTRDLETWLADGHASLRFDAGPRYNRESTGGLFQTTIEMMDHDYLLGIQVRPEADFPDMGKLIGTYDTPFHLPRGILGMITFQFTKVNGRMSLVVNDIQPSDGYREISSRTNHRKRLDPWRKQALDRLIEWALSRGLPIYARSPELVKKWYGDNLSDHDIDKNYTETYADGRWVLDPDLEIEGEKFLLTSQGENYGQYMKPWLVFSGSSEVRRPAEAAKSEVRNDWVQQIRGWLAQGSQLTPPQTAVNFFDEARRKQIKTVVIYGEPAGGLSWALLRIFPYLHVQDYFPNAKFIVMSEVFKIVQFPRAVFINPGELKQALKGSDLKNTLLIEASLGGFSEVFESGVGMQIQTYKDDQIKVRVGQQIFTEIVSGPVRELPYYSGQVFLLNRLGFPHPKALRPDAIPVLDESLLNDEVKQTREKFRVLLNRKLGLSDSERQERPVIYLNPFFGKGSIVLSNDYWVEAAKQIAARFPDSILLMHPGHTERYRTLSGQVAARIRGALAEQQSTVPILEFDPQDDYAMDIPGLTAVLTAPNVFAMTVNSGTGHLAEALGTPGITFTDAGLEFYQIYGLQRNNRKNFMLATDDPALWLDFLENLIKNRPEPTVRSEVRTGPLVVSEQEAERFANDLTELYYLLSEANGGDESQVTRQLIHALLRQLKHGLAGESPRLLLTAEDLHGAEFKRVRALADSEEVLDWMNHMREVHTDLLAQLEIFNEPDYSDLVFTPGRGDAVLILGPSMSGKSSLATALQYKDYSLGGESDSGYLMLRIPGYFLMAGAGAKLETIRARAWSTEPELNNRRVEVQNFGSQISLVKAVIQLNHPDSYKPSTWTGKARPADISWRWSQHLGDIPSLSEYGLLHGPVLKINVTHGYINPDGFRSLSAQIDMILKGELRYDEDEAPAAQSEVRQAEPQDTRELLEKTALDFTERLLAGLDAPQREAEARALVNVTDFSDYDEKDDLKNELLLILFLGGLILIEILFAGLLAALFGFVLGAFGHEASPAKLFQGTVALAAALVSYTAAATYKPNIVLSGIANFHGIHLFIRGDLKEKLRNKDPRLIGLLFHEWTHQLKRFGLVRNDRRVASALEWLTRYELEKEKAAALGAKLTAQEFAAQAAAYQEPQGFRKVVRWFWAGDLARWQAREFQRGYEETQKILAVPSTELWVGLKNPDRFEWSDLHGWQGVQTVLKLFLSWENYARSIRIGGMAAAVLDQDGPEAAWKLIRDISQWENGVTALMLRDSARRSRSEVRTPAWMNRPVEDLDEEAVEEGLRSVREEMAFIKSDLSSPPMNWDLNDLKDWLPDLSITDDLIQQYQEAMLYFNDEVLNVPDLTAEAFRDHFIELNKRVKSTPDAGEIVEWEDEAEINEVFERMFSPSFERLFNKRPLKAAAEIFVKLVNIQGFNDGNKRSSSFILNYILVKAGYPQFVLTGENAAEYFHVVMPIRQTAKIRQAQFEDFLWENFRKMRSEVRKAGETEILYPEILPQEVQNWFETKMGFGGVKVQNGILSPQAFDKPEFYAGHNPWALEYGARAEWAAAELLPAIETITDEQDLATKDPALRVMAKHNLNKAPLPQQWSEMPVVPQILFPLDKAPKLPSDMQGTHSVITFNLIPGAQEGSVIPVLIKTGEAGDLEREAIMDSLFDRADLKEFVGVVNLEGNVQGIVYRIIPAQGMGKWDELLLGFSSDLLALQGPPSILKTKEGSVPYDLAESFKAARSRELIGKIIRRYNEIYAEEKLAAGRSEVRTQEYRFDLKAPVSDPEEIFKLLGPLGTRDKRPSVYPDWLFSLYQHAGVDNNDTAALRAFAIINHFDMFSIHGNLVWDSKTKQGVLVTGVSQSGKSNITKHLIDGKRFVFRGDDSTIAYFDRKGRLLASYADYRETPPTRRTSSGKTEAYATADSHKNGFVPVGAIVHLTPVKTGHFEVSVGELDANFNAGERNYLMPKPIRKDKEREIRKSKIAGVNVRVPKGKRRDYAAIAERIEKELAAYFDKKAVVEKKGARRQAGSNAKKRSEVRTFALSPDPAKTVEQLEYKWNVLYSTVREADFQEQIEANRALLGDRDTDVFLKIAERAKHLSVMGDVMERMPEILGSRILTGMSAGEIVQELSAVIEELSGIDLAEELFKEVLNGEVEPATAEAVAELPSVSLEGVLQHLESLKENMQVLQDVQSLSGDAYVTASLNVISKLAGIIRELRTEYPEGAAVGLAIAESGSDLVSQQMADQHARALAGLSALISRMIVIGRLPASFQKMLNESGFEGIKLTLEGQAQNVTAPDGQSRICVVEAGDALKGMSIPPEILRVLLGEEGYQMETDEYSFFTLSTAVALQYAYSVIAALKLKKEMDPSKIGESLVARLGLTTEHTFVMEGGTMKVMVNIVQSLINEEAARSEVRQAA